MPESNITLDILHEVRRSFSCSFWSQEQTDKNGFPKNVEIFQLENIEFGIVRMLAQMLAVKSLTER